MHFLEKKNEKKNGKCAYRGKRAINSSKFDWNIWIKSRLNENKWNQTSSLHVQQFGGCMANRGRTIDLLQPLHYVLLSCVIRHRKEEQRTRQIVTTAKKCVTDAPRQSNRKSIIFCLIWSYCLLRFNSIIHYQHMLKVLFHRPLLLTSVSCLVCQFALSIKHHSILWDLNLLTRKTSTLIAN